MAQARDDGFELALAGITAQGADQVGPHKAPTSPGAVAAEVGTPFDRVQAVVAYLQTQQRQVGAYAGQPRQAGGAVGCQHDAVVHVAGVFLDLERALAIVVQAAQVQVGKGLAHEVANGRACGLWPLRKGVHQGQSGLAFDDACHQSLQDIAVD